MNAMFELDEFLFPTIFLNALPSTCTVSLRNARKRDYFEIQRDMELNSTPYKYNMRLDNVATEDAHVTIELMMACMKLGQYTENAILQGVSVEKMLAKSENSLELRIAFLTQSYSYNGSKFYLNVRVNDMLVCSTEQFELLARRNRKRSKFTSLE